MCARLLRLLEHISTHVSMCVHEKDTSARLVPLSTGKSHTDVNEFAQMYLCFFYKKEESYLQEMQKSTGIVQHSFWLEAAPWAEAREIVRVDELVSLHNAILFRRE